MPRRNRVDPWGDLHAVSARGSFTGNRGCLVDDSGVIWRHHAGSLWIVCRLSFRDFSHPLSEPRTWTPLFFLDDAVALAAGHRPCGFCRRADYESYRSGVEAADRGRLGLNASDLNRRLAKERLAKGRGLDRRNDRILWSDNIDDLPTGTVIIPRGSSDPHLVTRDTLQAFRFGNWGPPVKRQQDKQVSILTPPTSVAALANGFTPELRASANR